MNRTIRWSSRLLWGAGYAAVAVLLSRLALRQLQALVPLVCGGLEPALLEQIALAAGQLQSAVLVSPWIGMLLSGMLTATALGAVPKKLRLWVNLAAAAVLFLPAVGMALCLSEVNGIRVFSLVRCALALLLGGGL